jgi:hypothetical protein
MIPQTTEAKTFEYACVNEVPDLTPTPNYRPAFTPLQDRTRILIQNALPITLEFTAQALFQEIEETIRGLQEEQEGYAKSRDRGLHQQSMRGKLVGFLMTTAHLVDEEFNPGVLSYSEAEFLADRIICKLYRLLAPGNLKSLDVSGETATGPVSAAFTAVQDSALLTELRAFLKDVLELDPSIDHGSTENLLAIAKERREFVRARTRPVAIGHDYDMQEEEIKELQFQNAELSRQLEAAQASEKQFRNELGLINNEIQPFREELFAAELTHVSIDYIVSRLVFAWNKYKAETFNATRAADIQAIQKERDELGELVSDIKLVLAKHLADDPAINALGTVDLIDVKLASLRDASEKAHTFDSLKARLQQQVNRLLDFGLHDIQGVKGETDFVGVLHQLVSFRLGAKAAEQQQAAKDSSSPSEASSAIAPKAVVHVPDSDAVIQDKRSPFVKVAGHIQFRTDNPGIDWVKAGDFDIPVPLVKSAIMMAGGSKMPDGQPLHLSMVSQQLSLLPDAGTAIGRCFGGTIGKLRDGAATSGDVDEAIAKRLEKHRVVWSSPEGA